MKYKYQLILLGENTQLFDQVKISLAEKFDELKLISDLIKIITKENIGEYTGAQPAYVIYAGHKNNLDAETIDIIKKQKLDGNVILPIFESSFSDEIPEELSNQNGLQFKNNISKICNLILEGFQLLRKSRKVFISYRRSDSSNIAIQLFETLERNNFDVFLDTHSIDKGEQFQEELWHRMTDCDVILMLNSPEFLESEWCGQELEKAHMKRIGIVHLIWPDHEFQNFAHLSHSIQLKMNDFDKPLFGDIKKGRLKSEVVAEVINLVESVRARNLASRQDALITEFTQSANDNNVEVNLQFDRYISEKRTNGKKRIYIPTIGIPQSFNCFESQRLIEKIEKDEIESICLIFDEMSIRDYWLEHLDWLNDYLKVTTLKKREFNKWFSKV